MNYDTLLQEAVSYQEQILSHRHYLHTHAETGFDLHDTLTYVSAQLKDMGCEPIPCGKAGLVTLIGGKQPGKVFLLRADMDALPVREASGEPFACPNGRMHACGHDMHTAMLLGAARLLKDHEDQIPGTVKLMFQPAEEIFAGSSDMIDHGVLKDPAVDAAMMIHVMSGVPFAEGSITISPAGISAPAADVFEIQIQGKGCHGSSPNTGIDPLNVAAHILIALQTLHARELAMTDRAALTIGSLHAGEAPNVIPDTAVMGGSLRTFDEDLRAYLKQRLMDIAQATAAMFRAQATVTFTSGCPTLHNDPTLCQDAKRYLTALLGKTQVMSAEELAAMAAASAPGKRNSSVAGSEDFAYVSQKVPTVMLSLAAGHPDHGHRYPLHHPQVTFCDDVLPIGSAVHTCMAMRWLEEHR